MNYGRLISGGRWFLRRLCTAAAEAERPANTKSDRASKSLYRRLSSLDMTGGSVSETLNQYVMEGKAIRKAEVDSIIKELRNYRKFQDAFEIMEWMKMRNINFSLGNYAVYLDLVCKTKGVVAAENYFSGLPPRGKNKFTYGALLNCYCKELMTDKALAHFDKMDELGYVTNLSFNNLMSLYMRLGQPSKVPQLVQDMKQRKIPMQGFSYHIWMNSYASLNDLEGVENVYEEMKREDEHEISWLTYSNLAAIYVKSKQFEKAEVLLRMLEKKVGQRKREAYHCLLSLYAGTGNLEEVYRVWNSLKSVTPVTNFSYLHMFQALRRLNDTEGLIKCFKEWESTCVNYDVRLFSIGLGAYLSQNMIEEAELVFEVAKKRIKADVFKVQEMFIMFFLEKRQLDDAMRHLEEALSDVMEDEWCPSPEVVSAFLKYYEEGTDVDGVDELRKILKKYNFDDSSIETCIAKSKSSPESHPILKEDSQVNHVH